MRLVTSDWCLQISNPFWLLLIARCCLNRRPPKASRFTGLSKKFNR